VNESSWGQDSPQLRRPPSWELGQRPTVPVPQACSRGSGKEERDKDYAHYQHAPRTSRWLQRSINGSEAASLTSALRQLLAIPTAHFFGVQPQKQRIIAQEASDADLIGQGVVIPFLQRL